MRRMNGRTDDLSLTDVNADRNAHRACANTDVVRRACEYAPEDATCESGNTRTADVCNCGLKGRG
eukprot:13355309-Alexandrium_andersonii.AAC.1